MEKMYLKNPVSNSLYSINQTSLIHLPNSNDKTIELYGIAKGIEIDLSKGVKEHLYVTYDELNDTYRENMVTEESEFSVYDYISENPVVCFINPTNRELLLNTAVTPYTLYEKFGSKLDVLGYTDEELVTGADIIVTRNHSMLDELQGDVEVVMWTDNPTLNKEIHLTAPSIPQLIYPTRDVLLTGVKEIESLVWTATDKAKIAVTFDSAVTWYAYKSGVWIDIQNAHEGMTSAEFNAIPIAKINELRNGSNTIQFSYSLTEDAEVDRLIMKVSMEGREQLAKTSDYELSYNAANKTLTFLIKKDGTYTVNRMDSGVTEI